MILLLESILELVARSHSKQFFSYSLDILFFSSLPVSRLDFLDVVRRMALYIKPEWIFLLHLMLLRFSVFFSVRGSFICKLKIQGWL